MSELCFCFCCCLLFPPIEVNTKSILITTSSTRKEKHRVEGSCLTPQLDLSTTRRIRMSQSTAKIYALQTAWTGESY